MLSASELQSQTQPHISGGSRHEIRHPSSESRSETPPDPDRNVVFCFIIIQSRRRLLRELFAMICQTQMSQKRHRNRRGLTRCQTFPLKVNVLAYKKLQPLKLGSISHAVNKFYSLASWKISFQGWMWDEMTCRRGHFKFFFFCASSFLPVFHPLIINPCLVIFKSVSTAKLSVLTPSSLVALQILPVSHLVCLLFNHVEQQPLALPRQSVPPSPPLLHASHLLPISLQYFYFFRQRATLEGDRPCPFFFFFFCPASAHLFLCRLRSEQQGEWVFN